MNRIILTLVFLIGSVPALAAESAENSAGAKQSSSMDHPDHGARHVAVPSSVPEGLFYRQCRRAFPPMWWSIWFASLPSKVDFQRGFHPGDSFEVYYEVKDAIVRYTMLNVSDNEIAFYRYQPDLNSAAVYFDATGHSANGKMVLSGADLRTFSKERRKIRATVAAAPPNSSN